MLCRCCAINFLIACELNRVGRKRGKKGIDIFPYSVVLVQKEGPNLGCSITFSLELILNERG